MAKKRHLLMIIKNQTIFFNLQNGATIIEQQNVRRFNGFSGFF